MIFIAILPLVKNQPLFIFWVKRQITYNIIDSLRAKLGMGKLRVDPVSSESKS